MVGGMEALTLVAMVLRFSPPTGSRTRSDSSIEEENQVLHVDMVFPAKIVGVY